MNKVPSVNQAINSLINIVKAHDRRIELLELEVKTLLAQAAEADK